MSDKLIVNWDEYNNTVEKLAIQIEESGYKPTILIGIMRGAAPMIDVLSRIFKYHIFFKKLIGILLWNKLYASFRRGPC